jgi:hypothetical protein
MGFKGCQYRSQLLLKGAITHQLNAGHSSLMSTQGEDLVGFHFARAPEHDGPVDQFLRTCCQELSQYAGEFVPGLGLLLIELTNLGQNRFRLCLRIVRAQVQLDNGTQSDTPPQILDLFARDQCNIPNI